VHGCSGHRMIASPWICQSPCTQTHRRLEVEPQSPWSRRRPRHGRSTRAPGSRWPDDAARKRVKTTRLPPRGAPAQRGRHAERLQRRRSTRSGSGAARVPTAASSVVRHMRCIQGEVRAMGTRNKVDATQKMQWQRVPQRRTIHGAAMMAAQQRAFRRRHHPTPATPPCTTSGKSRRRWHPPFCS